MGEQQGERGAAGWRGQEGAKVGGEEEEGGEGEAQCAVTRHHGHRGGGGDRGGGCDLGRRGLEVSKIFSDAHLGHMLSVVSFGQQHL